MKFVNKECHNLKFAKNEMREILQIGINLTQTAS